MVNPLLCSVCRSTMQVAGFVTDSDQVIISCPNGCTQYKDKINPEHYKKHPSGVECIEITEHMNFCLGNAIKYIFRAEHKGDQINDLKKAIWYLEREITRLKEGSDDKPYHDSGSSQ